MKQYKPGCAGDPDYYRTGSTNPPKSYRGIIAVLMILVIVLMSIVTVLGMMNIRLFRMLEQQADSSVAFSEKGAVPATIPPQGIYIPSLGFTGEEIESVYRSYNEWPNGLYISLVEPDGPAAKADLRLGDILIAVDGDPITGKEDFQSKMESLLPGHPLQFTVFREDGEITVPLTPTVPMDN